MGLGRGEGADSRNRGGINPANRASQRQARWGVGQMRTTISRIRAGMRRAARARRLQVLVRGSVQPVAAVVVAAEVVAAEVMAAEAGADAVSGAGSAGLVPAAGRAPVVSAGLSA